MNRFIVPVILAAALSAHAAESELGQLDGNRTLFTVMCAINAGGYSADLSSPNNHPLRDAIRAELAKRNIPSLPAIKDFFEAHRRRSDTAELSQYISYALSIGPPPTFVQNRRDIEIPPDALALKDFTPLLTAFYREANIEDLWARFQAAFNQYIARYHSPVLNSVLEVNSYLRQQTSGFQGRRFQIYISLLAAPNQVQMRSYGNDFYVVVTPSPELRTFDIRHAYLVYLLDPLATRYQEILARKKVLQDEARRAPALDEIYKEDWLELVTQSLVKAVESRLDHNPGEAHRALEEGFILTPYFTEHLPLYEQQEESMLIYYQEMVSGIDNVQEDARLRNVAFASAPATKVVPAAPQPAAPPLSGAAKTLDDAEKLYEARFDDKTNLDKAKNLYLSALQQTNIKRLRATAFYGLARIAALQKDPETSQRLFLQTIDSDPEPEVKAWALVYLGRLSMAQDDRDQAVKYLQSALEVNGASDKARAEAAKSLQAVAK